LLGYLHPTAGSGRVLGLDIVNESVAVRRRIGYLPGGIALYDTLTGEQQLDYLAELNGRPPSRRAELCERLELSAVRSGLFATTRAACARRLASCGVAARSDLAILDEPAKADPLSRAFYRILDGLKAEGRTIFFSSHVLSEVQRVCDRVAIIRSGRLVLVEEVASLLARQRRNVSMRVDGSPPRLDGVAGVSGIETLNGHLTCRVEGDIGPFLAAITEARVIDLTIEAAGLEEAFLEFYEGAEPA
jgi:ABC-2 type transport system ATP-binding protein